MLIAVGSGIKHCYSAHDVDEKIPLLNHNGTSKLDFRSRTSDLTLVESCRKTPAFYEKHKGKLICGGLESLVESGGGIALLIIFVGSNPLSWGVGANIGGVLLCVLGLISIGSIIAGTAGYLKADAIDAFLKFVNDNKTMNKMVMQYREQGYQDWTEKDIKQYFVRVFAYHLLTGRSIDYSKVEIKDGQLFFPIKDFEEGEKETGKQKNKAQLHRLSELFRKLKSSSKMPFVPALQYPKINGIDTAILEQLISNEVLADDILEEAQNSKELGLWLHNQFLLLHFNPTKKTPHNARLYLDVLPGRRADVVEQLVRKLTESDRGNLMAIKFSSETCNRSDSIIIYVKVDPTKCNSFNNFCVQSQEILDIIADLQKDSALKDAFRSATHSPFPKVKNPNSQQPLKGVRFVPDLGIADSSPNEEIAKNIAEMVVLGHCKTKTILNDLMSLVVNDLYAKEFNFKPLKSKHLNAILPNVRFNSFDS